MKTEPNGIGWGSWGLGGGAEMGAMAKEIP